MGKRAKARSANRFKLLATVAVVGATAGVAGLGTFGTFTSTTTAQAQTDATGTVVLDHGTVTNRLSVGATNLAPGDTLQRGFELRNNGSIDLASITLAVSATTSSVLDTDATNGLQFKLDECSVAWVESASPYTYTCSGTTTNLVAYTAISAVKATPLSMGTLAALTAAGTDELVATIQLPSGADNSFQSKSSTLEFSFTGTQRAAANK